GPDPHGHVGAEVEVPHLEADETIPPRPEEEIADALRSASRDPEETTAGEAVDPAGRPELHL
ncbi:MAG TPA: hypothetical protein VGK17_15580, partial [Propionicimonas sp.]